MNSDLPAPERKRDTIYILQRVLIYAIPGTTSHEDANTVSLIVIEYCKLNNTSVLIKHTFRPFPDRVALLDIPLEKLSRSLDSACVCLSYHGHGL